MSSNHNKKILFFSPVLTHFPGGAERSTYHIINKYLSTNNYSIYLLGFNKINKSMLSNFLDNIDNINFKIINVPQYFKHLHYLNYLLVNFFIHEYFDEIHCYSIYAPKLIDVSCNKFVFYIRSETDIGIRNNYHTGFKRFLKYILYYLEYPFWLYHHKKLNELISKSDIIVNSKYMYDQTKIKFNKESTIIYPFIDEIKLRSRFNNPEIAKINKGIILIGDTENKGINTVITLSKIFKNEQFYIFSKNINKDIHDENIVYKPWMIDSSDVFQYAKLVLVPSIWYEAYGRVSREAFLLKIPVLVSNIGGLPESVDYEKKYIVENYKDIKAWVRAIENII